MTPTKNRDRQTGIVWNLFQWDIIAMLALAYLGYRANACLPPLKFNAWLISTYVIGPAIEGLGTILFVVFILAVLMFSLGAKRSFRLFPADEFSGSHWIPKLAVLLGCIVTIEVGVRILAAIL